MTDAAWHPDPLGRFELRYWDGERWTEHVATEGVQAVDPDPIVVDDGGTSSSDDDPAPDDDADAAGAVDADERIDAALDDLDAVVDDPDQALAELDGVTAADDTAAGETTGDDTADGDAASDDGDTAPPGGVAVVDELPGAAVLGVPRPRRDEVEQHEVDPDEVDQDEGDQEGQDAPAAAAPPAEPPSDEDDGPDLDALPPPSSTPLDQVAEQPGGADLGEDGIGGGLLDDAAYAERSTERVVLQNPRMLKVRLGPDVMIKRGSMVAYQGSMSFSYESEGGGVSGLLKRAVASDNSKMARVSGQGDLFLADDAFEIHMLELAGGGLVVNGPNLLAFEDGMTFRTRSLGNAGVVAGGVFVTDVSGHGWVAVTCHGTPVRLDTDVPTFVDVGSAVAWSSSLAVDLNVQKLSMKGMRSGEIAQLAFRGRGFVLVQASEGPYVPAAS